MTSPRNNWLLRRLLLFLIVAMAVWMWRGGFWLVTDQPQKADVIVVLAGETEIRPQRALELLRQNYAAHLYLNVPADVRLYQTPQAKIADDFLKSQPDAEKLSVCPITGFSTRDESNDTATCLAGHNVHSVLLVTSEFHTSRALAIFRRQLPGLEFEVAAAYGPSQFGPRWWQHRQWAKTFLTESLAWSWWILVDRWR